MVSAGVLCSTLAWFVCSSLLLGWLEYIEEPYERLAVGVDFIELSRMPSQWDRRYYRLNEHHGQEVQLLRRGGSAGVWLVVRPDRSVATLEIGHRPSVSSQPLGTVNYLPMPVLSQEQRTALVALFNRAHAGEVDVPKLRRYGGPRRGWQRAALAIWMVPVRGGRVLRWCL